jgi:release factor glutamine methyltransferase
LNIVFPSPETRCTNAASGTFAVQLFYMTIKKAFQDLSSQLEGIYEKGEAESIARMVIGHITGTEKMQVSREAEKEISSTQQQEIETAFIELKKQRPVQYVLGEAWFSNLKFYVDENVLIPRPETEELVNWITDNYKSTNQPLQILEVGTGSGCIAISMQKKLPTANVLATDISEAALVVAKQNAATLNAGVKFLMADFLNDTTWHEFPLFDIIVSNPPYIPITEKEKLDANVAEWEPSTALFVPDSDPLLFYRKIALFGKEHLKNKASIFVECHQEFAVAAKKMFEDYGYFAVLKKDIFENERMLKATIKI